jgi:uncharacterized iron-regulated membrane protein
MNPAQPTFAMRIVVQTPEGTIAVRYANPVSGRLVERDSNENIWRTMHDLHIFLLLDLPGLLVVFVSGWVLMACSLLGTVLGAPRLKKPRIALGVRWRANLRKLMLDLHNVTGIYVLLPMLLLGLTGATFILARLDPVDLPQPAIALAAAGGSPNRVIADRAALSAALDTLGYDASAWAIRQVKFPTEEQPLFAFDIDDPGKRYQTLFTDYSGSELVLPRSERDLSLWNRFKCELWVAIHEGYILGTPVAGSFSFAGFRSPPGR